uniref:Uncharacterized protein n=1 Tax=Octopus bimaculoides TaxID=37653 RepID=A0A0L8IA66_OCTBM
MKINKKKVGVIIQRKNNKRALVRKKKRIFNPRGINILTIGGKLTDDNIS